MITYLTISNARIRFIMDANDSQHIVRAYSSVVDHRLAPGNEAHELGQALIRQVNSETPVPSKDSLIRGFFEKVDCDNGK